MAQLAIVSQTTAKIPSLMESPSLIFMYSVITLQSEPRKLCRCLIAQVMKPPKRVAAPSLNIHVQRWECNREKMRTQPLPPRTRMHLGLSSTLHFTLSCPSLFCRLAVELFHGHLWIGSQLIYSQRVTGETSDMLFRLATNNNSSNDGRDDGGGSCLPRFQLLIETRQNPPSPCASLSQLRITS